MHAGLEAFQSITSDGIAELHQLRELGLLADKSRPDIALAVNKLQRRSAAPRQEDVEAL